MTLSARNKTISSKYVLVTCIAVVLSWVLHEFAHWVAGTLLGYEMGMTFNKAFPANGYTTDWHYQVISAAGPGFYIDRSIRCFYDHAAQKDHPSVSFFVHLLLYAAVRRPDQCPPSK
ncbi:MAG: hypothetical protein WDO16_16040 [Bacteroidota bacterium]